MANLETIVDALADALEQIEGLYVFKVPAQVHTPCAQIVPQKVDFAGTMGRGCEDWEFVIRILISTASQSAAQDELFKYFGQAKDIKDVIENHRPLNDGSAADTVFVKTAEDYGRLYEVEGIPYRGIEFIVEVTA